MFKIAKSQPPWNVWCNLAKTCILGMMPGERRISQYPGALRMQNIDNTKKWTKASSEENIRVTWRKRSCAAGAAIKC